MTYSVEKQVEPPSDLYSGINILELDVYRTTNPYRSTSFELVCKVSQGMNIGWTYADVSAFDEADQVCFHGDYPPFFPDLSRFPIGTQGG